MRDKLFPWLFDREAGRADNRFCTELLYARATTLELHGGKVLLGEAKGGITCLSLDHVERRFLLASAQDTTISCFDMLVRTPDNPCFKHLPPNSPQALHTVTGHFPKGPLRGQLPGMQLSTLAKGRLTHCVDSQP